MANTVPVYIRIGNRPERHVGNVVIDDRVYTGEGPRVVANLLRSAADAIEVDLPELEDEDDPTHPATA
jgi:hypothetical protein